MSSAGIALVTGGTSGIGKGVASALVGEGWRVVVTSRTDEGAPDGTVHIPCDVSDDSAVSRLVGTVGDQFGGLDLLVNNAGIGPQIPHDDLDAATPELWSAILGVNLLGPWHLVAASRAMLERSGRGHVINVASIAGLSALGSSIPYSVSKAGLIHMTRLLARALAPTVRVNAVAPGWIDSPRNRTWPSRARMLDRIPLDRHGQPADVANAVLGLETMTYVTGEVVCVDGGMHLT